MNRLKELNALDLYTSKLIYKKTHSPCNTDDKKINIFVC